MVGGKRLMSVTSETDLVIYHVHRYTFVEREFSADADCDYA